jgi:hypothetical protein
MPTHYHSQIPQDPRLAWLLSKAALAKPYTRCQESTPHSAAIVMNRQQHGRHHLSFEAILFERSHCPPL